MLPEEEFARALEASRRCEVLFSVGTSALVHPAASLPLEALDAGAWVVEVNPQRTPLTPRADYFLEGVSGAILPALLNAAWPV
jgi:NAD-dependent deacetylase